MATGPQITLRDLPQSVRTGGTGSALPAYPAPVKSDPFNLHANEHTLMLQALDETGGNITHAARKLGISRRTLHRKIKLIHAAQQTPGVAGQPISEPPSL